MSLLLLLLSLPAIAVTLSEKQRALIAERLQSPAKVCLQDESCASQRPVSTTASARDGAGIYQTYCSSCHLLGVAGAPKLEDTAAWQQRLGQGIEQLYLSVINGKGGMPARGVCLDCSDDELRETVDYILSQQP